MAGLAADTFMDVNAVVEISKIGQIVHARPGNRLSCSETLAYGFERRARIPDLGMAIHASLGRRNTGERRSFNRCVTIAAIDTLVPDMMSVAKGHRLLARDAR